MKSPLSILHRYLPIVKEGLAMRAGTATKNKKRTSDRPRFIHLSQTIAIEKHLQERTFPPVGLWFHSLVIVKHIFLFLVYF